MQPGDSADELSFSQLVFSDLAGYRPGARPGWLSVAARLPFVPGLVASLILRAQQCLFRAGHERLARSLQTLGVVLVGADLGPGMRVGTCFQMVHPVGVTIGFGLRIGDNVVFAGGVVAAARYYDEPADAEQSFATICDGARIGAHAVLVGGVTVGRNAMVGANSVVLSDVPEGAVVLGNPARRVGTREATR